MSTTEHLVSRATAALNDADWDAAHRLFSNCSAGPAILAERVSGAAALAEALGEALAPYRTATGAYRIETEWRYVIATRPM